jgi:hypothetical protein
VFSLYRVVLFIHLAVVIFIIGPLAVGSVTASRAVAQGKEGLEALRSGVRTFRIYGALSILAPIFGSAMIGLGGEGKEWKFSQAWVSASFALYLVAILDVFLVLLPSTRKALAAVEAGETAEVLQGRIQAAGGVAMLCWTLILVFMVFKPGGHGG